MWHIRSFKDDLTNKGSQKQGLITGLCILLLLCGFRPSGHAQNISRPNIAAPSGIQVNSYTGVLFTQRTDLLIPAPGLPLDISFAYNSAARLTDQGFGFGWTFGYNQTYTVDSTGSVIIMKDDGREDRFVLVNSAYQSPTGVFDVLSQYQSGKFKLVTKEGTEYFFDDPTHSKLTRITDRNDNKIILSYTSGKLTTLSDSLGHVVTLNWTNNRVNEIVASAGGDTRKVSYEYNTLGCLVQVRKPHGVVLSYVYNTNLTMNSYADGNGNYTLITYNRNNAVTRLNSCQLEQRISYNIEQRKTYVTEVSDGKTLATTYEFDASGRLLKKFGNCCGFSTAYEYDKHDNIGKITDGNGGVRVMTYDAMGNLLAETDPLNNTSTYTYNAAFNRVASVKDKKGSQTNFGYDAKGNLIQATDPLSQSLIYTYDSKGNKLTLKNKRGHVTTYAYDPFGYLIRMVGRQGDTTSLTYDPWGNVLTRTDPRGNVTTYTYDSLSRVIQVRDALNGINSFSYDANGNQVSITDVRGKITALAYDWRDQPLSVIDALNNKTLINYDGMGNVVSRTDANGHTTEYQYDNLSRLTAETNAAGESTHYSYDGVGNKTAIIYPNGNTVQLRYDALNRVTEISDIIGTLAKYAYDANSNKLTEQDGLNNTTAYQYDVINRVVSSTDALGNATQFTYDENGNLLQETDRKGNTTQYTYDSLDRRKTLTDALSFVTTYGYDKASNLTSVTDAKSNVTLYAFDAMNRLVQERFADNTTKSYTYDSVSNLKTRTDNNGQVTTFTYDALNRPVLRAYSATAVDTFSFDKIGMLLSARSKGAAVLFAYDGVNRIKSESLNGKTTAYSYNVAAGKKVITYPGGRMIERQMDRRGRLTAIRESGLDIAAFEYDAADRNIRRTYQNGTVTNLVYNGNGYVTELNHNPARFVDFGYTYDKEGNPTQTQFRHRAASTEQYSYDNIYQVTGYNKGGTPTGSFAYDGVGNRNSAQFNSTTASYTANSMNAYSSIVQGSTINLSYDNNGNLTGDGTRTFSYDEENRMIAVNSGTTARYAYDALGRRIQKVAGNDTTNYLFDGLEVIEERSVADSVKASYVWGRWVDDIVAMQRNGQGYFYHTNTLGSVVSVTNASGAVVERYEYDVYGKPTVYDGAFVPLTGGSTIENPYLYTGRENDRETGFHYYRTRYYDPEHGRFMQRDPLGYLDGLGMYTYVSNNPSRFIDPLGTSKVDCECLKKLIDKGPEISDWKDYTQEVNNELDEFGNALERTNGKLGSNGKVYFSPYARGNQYYSIVSNKWFKAVGIANTFKDVVEVASSAYYENGLGYNTQLELAGIGGEVLGQTIGRTVGGVLGAFGGPLGAVVGGTIGGYLGGVIGKHYGKKGMAQKIYDDNCE